MTDQTDSQLLKTYAERRHEAAFAELVRRHVDFVYSAALRMVRDPHLAEDVTQGVFIALAKQAPGLVERVTLTGWLHRAAQNIAAQSVRTITRRRAREQEAVAMNELISTSPDASWEHIEPHLDAALGELSDADRDAVLLRYFQKKSAAEIAAIFGVSDEAAQKRVSRAVERLREFFARRGVTVGAGGLVVVSTNAVQSAPVGLAATISAAALAGIAVTSSTLIATTAKTIAMTSLQKTLITATLAVVAGAGIYEAKQAHDARAEVQTLQQQQAPLADKIQQLQGSFAEATNRLAVLLAENTQLKSTASENELLKLRGEVTVLENRLNSTKQSGPASATNEHGIEGVALNFENLPAIEVLDLYQKITKVGLVGATNASRARFGVTLRTNDVSPEQAKHLLEQALLEQSGVILTPLDQDRISIAYDDQLEVQHFGTNLPQVIFLTANDVVSNSVRVITSPSNPVQNLVLRLIGKTSDEIKAIDAKGPEFQIMNDGVLLVKSESCGLQAKIVAGKPVYTGLVLIFSKYDDAKLAEKILRGN